MCDIIPHSCTVSICNELSGFPDLIHIEQQNDLLVCGDCQTNFPLRDITKFIRHKVNRCNKENVNCDPEPVEGEADDDDPDKIIGNKRTPIIAPIARKESIEGSAKSPRQALDSSLELKQEKEENEESSVKEEEKDVKDRLPFRLKQVDAESNTINSEPLKVTCETCRKLFISAWSLLQHAQREHGMRIYVTTSRDSLTPSQSPRVSTPLQRIPKPDDHNRELDHRYKDDRKHKDDLHIHSKERRSDSTEPHRATSSVGSASSGEGPLSGHPSPHNPFMFPRMPFDVRHPLSPIPGLGPLGARPGDLRLDFTGDLFHNRGMPGLFNLPVMEHGPGAPFHPFEQRRIGRMSPDDFYSQRLRQLANPTSPSQATKRTPPFTPTTNAPNRMQGIFSPLTPPTSNTTEGEKRSENPRSLTPPGNQKSCEFCGKAFRFQSNLIVHRRSHTGEKPFKCPLCPHACTQQSKLKRHMKTHMSKNGGLSVGSNMSNASEGSHASSSSTPDSNKMGEDDEDAEDEEEEEEMEEEEEDPDMAAYYVLREEQQRIAEMRDRRENDQIKHNSKDTEGRSELAARLFDKRIEETITSELSKNTDPQKKGTTLLSEVFERTGLTDIPNYNEALKLAIAENVAQSTENGHHRTSSNGDGNQNKNKVDGDDKERGLKRDKPDDIGEESGIMSISKMIKKEPTLEKARSPMQKEILRSNSSMEPFFPGFWFPTGHPEYFRGLPLPRYSGLPDNVGNLHHNGFGLTTSTESPLTNTSITSSSAPTTPMSNAEPILTSAQRKEKMRNDTCEYCGKIFKNCSNLTVHRRSHTGEKPYKCMLCSYSCAQSSKLTRHMKTHGRYGKDVYNCKFCKMPFSVPSTLEKHMRKCVENTSGAPISMDGEDTNSNSDNTSASDSMSSTPNTAPLNLRTPLSLASSLGLPLFSVPRAFEKQMRKNMENNNTAADGDDTGSNSDAASTSESMLTSPMASLSSNVSHLGLPSSSLSSQLAATGVPLGLPQSFGMSMSGSGLKLEPNISVKLESNMGIKLETNMKTSSPSI